MDLGLQDKRVLVTGSTSGLGEAMAKGFAREGARVVVHGRNAAAAEIIAGAIARAGGSASIVLGDLMTDTGARQVIDGVRLALGGVDVLVNNAGGRGELTKSFFDVSIEEWREQYDEDLVSGVRMIQAFAPAMREARWGRIINVSTGLARRPFALGAHMSAAKTALLNMTLSCAKALSGTGVTVNAIVPGAIQTAALERLWVDIGRKQGFGTTWQEVEPFARRTLAQNACERIGSVEEIAATTAFLASEGAGFINASLVSVDGGAIATL